MNEKLSAVIKHPATLPVAVGVVALGSGLAVGFFLGRRTGPSDKYVDISAETEKYEAGMERVKQQLDTLRTERETRPPKVIIDAEALEASRDTYVIDEPDEEVIQTASPEPEAEVTVNGEAIRRSIFPDVDDEWNMDEEVANRTSNRPYVIHREEFFEETEEDLYRQRTLTYYNGDDTLVDEDNSPIYNYVQVVGDMKFGHGSGDPNVVYIRNEKLKAEYEILLDAGLYSMEVLGMSIEDNQKTQGRHIQHSGVKRFPRE